MRTALLSLLLAVPGRVWAAESEFTPTGKTSASGYDELVFLGWNNACSVAVQYFSYPPLGEELQGVPDTWSIGTITLPPGETSPVKDWAYKGITNKAWDRNRAEQTTEQLLRQGYVRAGFIERLRDAPVADHPGLKDIIHSTMTFKMGADEPWPPASYALTELHYSELGNCAFLVFSDPRNPRDSHRHKLLRIPDPALRRLRARAHVTNGVMLYKKSDIYAAEEELEIAVDMDPRYPLALYYHAVLLATHGRFDASLERLEAAIKLDKKYADKARNAVEFDGVRRGPRFKAIVGREGPKIFRSKYDEADYGLPQAGESPSER